MKKNKVKNNLDEMQEQKLLQIEHNGCWFAFWGLLASMIVQNFMYDSVDFAYVGGEWIVFMCLALYLGFGCIKNGIWDRRYKADTATNLMFSLVAALIAGALNFVKFYQSSDMLGGSIASGFVVAVFVFVICFAVLMISAEAYKRRIAKMEAEDLEESENE